MKTNQLEAFLAIAHGKGVAGAADALCVTQPAITKSIGNLEAELGVPLFERSSNRLELNNYGEILLRRAEAARAELTLAVEEIELMKKRTQESIKFNCSPIVMPKLIPRAISLFRQKHPHVHIQLAGRLEDTPANKISALLDGEYDLLITVIDENETLPNITYEKLLDIDVIFVASKDHPALKLKNPTFKQLSKYYWLFPGVGGLPYQKLQAAFRNAGAPMPQDVLTLSHRQMTFSLLKEGNYLAAIPYHPKCFEWSMSNFQVLNVNAEGVRWPLHLIKRENTIYSITVLDFIALIKNLVLEAD